MHFLGSAVVVVLIYLGIFAIFVSIDGRAKLPTVKFQQTFWFPGYASVFDISWFITNNSSFSIFVSSVSWGFTVVQLVAIKDLLWRCRAPWFFVFECKRILCSNAFSSSLLQTCYLWKTLHSSCASLPPTHPFTATHCLKFIKTSLVHACLA